MTGSPTPDPGLDDASTLLNTQTRGVHLTTDTHEAALAVARSGVVELFRPQRPRSYWAPPVIAASVVTRTGYPDSFPYLLGAVAGGGQDPMSSPDDLVLTPAACHHVYPLIEGSLITVPVRIAVESTCFRNEATAEAGRMRSFRMREVVFAGTPDDCLAWRDESLDRASAWLRRLGLDVRTVVADDPFFGRGAALMRASQREQQLKWELLAPVQDGIWQAVASCNYHKDHFGAVFGFHGADGATGHSACAAFGLDRLALALLSRHGPDITTWPRPAALSADGQS